MRLTKIFLFLVLQVAITAQAQTPSYSIDGDTLHLGNVAIVKNNYSPLVSPTGNALLGTAPEGIIATTWGPEMRLTHFGDSLTVDAPQMCLLGDTIFIASCASNSPGSGLPLLIKSQEGGENWSDPWYIPDIDTAAVEVEWYLRFFGGRLNACGQISGNSQFMFDNCQAKFSTNQGRTWSLPNYFFPEYQRLINFGGGAASDDTILFAFHRIAGHSDYDMIDSIETVLSFNNGNSWTSPADAVYDFNNNYRFRIFQSQGKVHLIYQMRSQITYLTEIYYASSSDWGGSWTSPIIVSDDSATHSQWPSLSASSDGRLVVAWFDYKYGDGGGGFTGDILFRVSVDNGISWGPEGRLTQNHSATASQSFINGDRIGIVWVDHRESFFHSELYYAESSDLGATWSDEMRLTNDSGRSYNPQLFFQDGSLYLTWLDARNNPPFGDDVYFRRAVNVVGIEENEKDIPDKAIIRAYPNPFNSSTTIIILYGQDIKISISDIAGRKVATLHAQAGRAVWDASGYPSGLYFARMQSGGAEKSIKLVLIK